jgi:DNA-binding MarR family transcriptional regulator
MTKPLFPTRSAIMSRLGVAFLTWRRYLQRNLAPYGITLKQHYVLRQLDQNEYLFPSDIAEALFCDRPTATVILDNLEKQGWVRRETDPDNRKYTRISITPGGREKLAELQALPDVDFDPLDPFTEEELREFSRLLTKLNHHLDQIRDKE